MKGKTKFVKSILSSTLNKTGGAKNTTVSGVGLNGEPHLGLQLKILSDISKKDNYINCNFQILRSGNAHEFLEKYVKSGEELNVAQLSALKDLYFKTEYFVKDENLSKCDIRYKVEDKATIIKYNNKGLEIEIISIEKYPDDPDKHTVISTFGAYYSYKFEGKKRYKKDDNLQ